MSREDRFDLAHYTTDMKFLPGGRYIYYAGRAAKFWNNCYLLRGEEDTREEWARLSQRAISCLMTGGGIGADYSIFRAANQILSRTGGFSSGPIPLMHMINEDGRHVMQGGSRRSAIYACLNWLHADAPDFLKAKDWHNMMIHPGYSIWDAKQDNFNFHAPLDMTNISLNYDNEFLEEVYGLNIDEIKRKFLAGEELKIVKIPDIFMTNVGQALKTGEPGFSFNFFEKVNETLRNACTEVTSEDDSDVCNLGSVNMAAIETIDEFRDVVAKGSKFLVCGTIRAELPYDKVHEVRAKNRRLGLGLMGMHEWLMQRGMPYEVTPELREWLQVYKDESERAANEHCDRFYLNRPAAYRAIAPTGSIGILAGTTTGIEPLFAVAYKRRYLKDGDKWKYEYVVDSTAESLIQKYGCNPDNIESALDLAKKPEQRIKFQADVQDYVDMSISSTINLPEWGTTHNNEDKVKGFANILAKYAHRLRGFTCYPDGARGGQPLTPVPYEHALKHKDVVLEEMDVCSLTGGGTCGA